MSSGVTQSPYHTSSPATVDKCTHKLPIFYITGMVHSGEVPAFGKRSLSFITVGLVKTQIRKCGNASVLSVLETLCFTYFLSCMGWTTECQT